MSAVEMDPSLESPPSKGKPSTWSDVQYETLLEECKGIMESAEEKKQQSVAGKRRLLEETKTVKASSEDEKVDLSRALELVKSYQSEMDLLSKRCRSTETSFNKLYKLLSSLPDPSEAMNEKEREADALAGELEAASRAEEAHLEQIKLLQNSVRDLESEFTKVKNQEVTVRRLEEALVKAEEEKEEALASVGVKKDQEWAKKMQESIASLELALESANQEKLLFEKKYFKNEEEKEDAKNKIEELMGEHNSRLLEKQAEIEALLSEIEKLEFEKESSFLSREGGEGEGGEGGEGANLRFYEPLVQGLQEKVGDLTLEIEGVKREKRETDAKHEAERRKLEEQLRQGEDLIAQLSEKNAILAEEAERSSESLHLIGDLRAKLKNEEIVELGGVDHADLETFSDLERRLLKKQEESNNKITKLRVQLEELEKEKAAFEKAVFTSEQSRADLQSLVKQMEGELALLGAEPSKAFPSAVQSEATHQGGELPSLSEIARQQRDRFRSKVLEVEAARDSLKRALEGERAAKDYLYKDNVKLLEQVKFWKFRAGGGGGGGQRGCGEQVRG